MKLRILIIPTLLMLSELGSCALIPKNPIFETDSKQCYTCDENCASLSLAKCEGADQCFSKLTRTSGNTTVESKGCVEAAAVERLCSNENEEIVSCYTCDDSFCNGDTVSVRNGVTKCYVCINECANPPEQHICEEVLETVNGEAAKAACMSYEVREDDLVTISKGCVLDTEDIRQTCAYVNVVYEGITCSICETDLCNWQDENHNYVDQCYYCMDDCEQLEIQDCEEGVNSKCGSVDFNYGGDRILARGCIEVTDSIDNYCNLVNLLGGNCTLCDTNLCNGDGSVPPEPTTPSTPESTLEPEPGNYVDECYYCMDSCEEIEIQNCEEALGEGARSKCGAIDFVTGGNRIIARGCIEVTDSIQTSCNLVNILGGNCTICDTNLCNGVQPEPETTPETTPSTTPNTAPPITPEVTETIPPTTPEPIPENYVDECYFCEASCDTPLEIHQCKEVLGEDAKSKCIAVEFEIVGQTVTSRGCTEVTNEVQASCDLINQQGGNCTICDTNLCNGVDTEDEDNNEDPDGSGSERIISVIYVLAFTFCLIKMI